MATPEADFVGFFWPLCSVTLKLQVGKHMNEKRASSSLTALAIRGRHLSCVMRARQNECGAARQVGK